MKTKANKKEKVDQKRQIIRRDQYEKRLSRLNLNTLNEIKNVLDIMEGQDDISPDKYLDIPDSKFEKADISPEEARNLFWFLTNLGVLPVTPLPQREGYLTLEPPIWQEVYVANYGAFQKALKSVIENKAQIKDTPLLYLDVVGDLYREPKDKYCYSMSKSKGRHKIIRYFIENKIYAYCPTRELAVVLGKDKTSFMKEVGKINTLIQGKLKIKDKIIEGRTGSGYRMNPKYKIVLKNK